MYDHLMPRFRDRAINFCRLSLGLKPVIDRIQSNQRLNGLADLPVQTIFDVGANVGKVAKTYRKRFPHANIYCIEPLPDCQERLGKWANRDGRVVVFPCAVGASPGHATFWWNTTHRGGSSLIQPDASRVSRELRVEVETLDRLASKVDLRDDVLVKIDVEGFELAVMQGGEETLRRATAVVVEVTTMECDSRPAFAEIVSFLDRLGYIYRGNMRCAWVQGVPYLADAVFVKRSAARQQILRRCA